MPFENGSNMFSLNQAWCCSPTLPLPSIGYINPFKSSADGGKKNLNLPLPLPLFLALAAENLFCLSTPLVSSNIVLKSWFKSVEP